MSDPATKKKPNKGIDVKKKIADLAGELSKIQKELDKTKDGNKKRGTKDLESGGLANILDSLARSMEVVKVLLENHTEDNCPRVKVLEEKTRLLEDSGDLQQQKALKGKFMISAPRKKDSIASEAKLKEENKSLPKYVTELVYNKLGQTLKEDEIVSCHHTTTGSIMSFQTWLRLPEGGGRHQGRRRQGRARPLHQLCTDQEEGCLVIRGAPAQEGHQNPQVFERRRRLHHPGTKGRHKDESDQLHRQGEDQGCLVPPLDRQDLHKGGALGPLQCLGGHLACRYLETPSDLAMITDLSICLTGIIMTVCGHAAAVSRRGYNMFYIRTTL